MIGAIEFMKRWKKTCDAYKSCDNCLLRDSCRGAMARLTEKEILDIITMVMYHRDPEMKEVKRSLKSHKLYNGGH